MKYISLKDKRLFDAHKSLAEASEAVHQSALRGETDDALHAALIEAHKAQAAAAASKDEFYCAPCNDVHEMDGSQGVIVVKRLVCPRDNNGNFKYVERSVDLHIPLCKQEWERLNLPGLIAKLESDEVL